MSEQQLSEYENSPCCSVRSRYFCSFRQSALLRLAVARAAARADFEFLGTVDVERQDMHRACQSAIIGAWGEPIFRDSGTLASSWQMRLVGLTDDTQGMLDLWSQTDSATLADEAQNERTLRRFSI